MENCELQSKANLDGGAPESGARHSMCSSSSMDLNHLDSMGHCRPTVRNLEHEAYNSGLTLEDQNHSEIKGVHWYCSECSCGIIADMLFFCFFVYLRSEDERPKTDYNVLFLWNIQ